MAKKFEHWCNDDNRGYLDPRFTNKLTLESIRTLILQLDKYMEDEYVSGPAKIDAVIEDHAIKNYTLEGGVYYKLAEDGARRRKVTTYLQLTADASETRYAIADIYLSKNSNCLLYTSDAASERSSEDLGGLRIIKKK